jgi:hypothetical protein
VIGSSVPMVPQYGAARAWAVFRRGGDVRHDHVDGRRAFGRLQGRCRFVNYCVADDSRATATAVKHRYGHRVKCAVIARQAVDGLDCDQAFEDLSESVREAYRCNGEGKLVLVRPGSLADVEGLSGHMQEHWLA